jgi:hypothetical protein
MDNKNKFFLSLNKFYFVKYSDAMHCKRIEHSDFSYHCYLKMTLQEEIRDKEFCYEVLALTVPMVAEGIKSILFNFYQRLAVINFLHIEQLEPELKKIIAKANQFEGFIRADYSRWVDNVYGPEIYIPPLATVYIRQYFSHRMGYMGEEESALLPYTTITFCGDDFSAQPANSDEFVLRAKFFSLLSWEFDTDCRIIDPTNFHITIIVNMYDHEQQWLVPMKFRVASLRWIEEQSKNNVIVWLRRTLVVKEFNEEIIKRHLCALMLAVAEEEQEGYLCEAAKIFSFAFDLPPFYLKFLAGNGTLYSE